MDHLISVEHSYLIPLLPLLGAIISGFFGAKFLKGQSHWPIWLGVGTAAVLSILLLINTIGLMPHDDHANDAAGATTSQVTEKDHGDAAGSTKAPKLWAVKDFFTWISAGNFVVKAGFFFDPLTAVMLTVVCGIGFFITVFAAGYMKGEEGYFRFFAYLGLFIFAMTCLVMGNNLILLYLGWEGVGLCSYLLIGYYYEKPAAREAAKKAFLVNRVGDFGFAIGIMLAYWAFGTVSYFGDGPGTANPGLLELAKGTLNAKQELAMQWIPFCLMMGAFGKSAQFPLHVWLPDAMEGPTPVSALIHAATMVTAGVYMIARCGTLFVGHTGAMLTVAFIGAFTAIFAASIALRQFDLKKVFAYSTVSQLGFMFVGVGLWGPVAAVFHLITHAFFKALLFLSSGVVMHGMNGELDMRKFSGIKRVLPKTRILMLIGCIALAGFPLFAGFFSKDEIIANAWVHNKFLGIVLLLTAFMTSYYTFRLYFRVFEGPEVLPPAPAHGHGHGHGHDDSEQAAQAHDPHGVDAHGHDAHGHGDHGHHNHEPAIMIIPLVVLAIGAIFAGYMNWPKHFLSEFLGHSPSLQMAYEVANVSTKGDPTIKSAMGQMHEAHLWEEANKTEAADEHRLHYIFMGISSIISIAGIALAYQFHLKDRDASERMLGSLPIKETLEKKWYIDELYQGGIVEPLRHLGQALFIVDRFVVDGMVWFAGFVPQVGGFTLKRTMQRGYLQGYAAAMLFGIVAILIVVLW